jgi:hypothetical protein
MGFAMKTAYLTAVCAFMLLAGGCRTADDKPIAKAKPFMDDKKQIPSRLEWSSDFFARSPRTFAFRVSASEGPFTVIFVTDKGWQGAQGRDRKAASKEDLLLVLDSKGPETVLEENVNVPAGRSWIMVENRTDKAVEFHVQLFDHKR